MATKLESTANRNSTKEIEVYLDGNLLRKDEGRDSHTPTSGEADNTPEETEKFTLHRKH
jgi:hypothetical protein